MGFEMPPVRGMERQPSQAAQSRQAAREMEYEMWAAENNDDAYRAAGGIWTTDNATQWNARREDTTRAWNSATELSIAAGHDFAGRGGVQHNISSESLSAMAVRKYLEGSEGSTWPAIKSWVRPYKRKKNPLAGVPKAASAKAARRR